MGRGERAAGRPSGARRRSRRIGSSGRHCGNGLRVAGFAGPDHHCCAQLEQGGRQPTGQAIYRLARLSRGARRRASMSKPTAAFVSRIRRQLHAAEAASDASLLTNLDLMRSIVSSRQVERVPTPYIGQQALIRLARAVQGQISTANDIFRAHEELHRVVQKKDGSSLPRKTSPRASWSPTRRQPLAWPDPLTGWAGAVTNSGYVLVVDQRVQHGVAGGPAGRGNALGGTPERLCVAVLVGMPVVDAVYHSIVGRGASMRVSMLDTRHGQPRRRRPAFHSAEREQDLSAMDRGISADLGARALREGNERNSGSASLRLSGLVPFHLEVAALLVGIGLHAKRVRRTGTYRSWRTSLPRSPVPAPRR